MTRKGLFVTGTDTNVGKTVTAAALLQRYQRLVPLRYWKPVQTGIEQDNDTEEVRRLSACDREGIVDSGIRLPRPVSPHLAARLAGVDIDVDAVVADLPADAGRALIVEGAGGVFVPLNGSQMMIDLIDRLGLAAFVVSRSTLGTINHTLLTLEALRRRNLSVAGVAMVGPLDAENRKAIEQYGRVSVVAEMPTFNPLDATSVGEWATRCFDPAGTLLEYLR